MSEHVVETPEGPARTTTTVARAPSLGTLVLGHGAGGQRWTKDVLAVRDAAVDAGWTVVLVDQPWRVAGRRVGPAPAALDRAWLAVLSVVGETVGDAPLVVGGRSAGARVACRAASAVGATAVLALSFPLHPPGRPGSSRAPELRLPATAGIPVHVVQGRTDPFGTPAEVADALAQGGTVDAVDGTHSLERVAGEVGVRAVALLPGGRDGPAAAPRAAGE